MPGAGFVNESQVWGIVLISSHDSCRGDQCAVRVLSWTRSLERLLQDRRQRVLKRGGLGGAEGAAAPLLAGEGAACYTASPRVYLHLSLLTPSVAVLHKHLRSPSCSKDEQGFLFAGIWCFFKYKIEKKYIFILCGISRSIIFHRSVLHFCKVLGENLDLNWNYTNRSS